MATKSKEIYRKYEDGSLRRVGFLPAEDVSSRVDNVESSINNLNNAVADRYTKGETDNLVNQNIPLVGNRQAYEFYGGGKHSYCLVCKIKILYAYQNVDLRFEYGGNGGPLNTVAIVPFANDFNSSSNWSFKIWSFYNGSYKFWLKDMGNGEANVYCDIVSNEGYLYITRVYGRMLAVHQVTMLMESADSIPDGAVSSAPYLWGDYAQSAGRANEATNATFANIMKSAPGQYQQLAYNVNNRPANWDEINAACYNGIRAQLVTSNLGDKTEPDGTIITFGWDMGDWETQLLIPGGDSSGKVFNPMIRNEPGRREYGSWHTIPYMEDVLSSSGGTIDAKGERCPLELKGGTVGSRQNIRLYPSSSGGYWTAIAFLDSSANDYGLTPSSWFVGAKEGFFGISKNGDGLYEEGSSYLRNNGDTWEFKGNSVITHCDLQSTSLVTSPRVTSTKMSQHGKLQVSAENEPNYKKQKKTRDVYFGSVKKTVTADMNPFMEYFFDHGYHFDNGEEGNGSEYDVGIVAYSNLIYYCVFQLNSDGSSSFSASPIETHDSTGKSVFLLKENGHASNLSLDDNQLFTSEDNALKFPVKGGIVATIGDFYDGLNVAVTNKALTANQGKVLNDKITALSNAIDSIKFSSSNTRVSVGAIGADQSNNEPMLRFGTSISGGNYGTFYTIWGFENGHKRDYGVLAVTSTSDNPSSMTGTNTVSLVSGENGYWGAQWLALSVFVPANKTYYIFGCRVTSVRYSYVRLSH